MSEEAKRIVNYLRGDACNDCLFNHPIESCKGDKCYLRDAADLIEEMSADRDRWKSRAEIAEQDMTPHCPKCRHYQTPECKTRYKAYTDSHCNPKKNCWEWRGPCAENGGVDKE